MWKSLLLGLLVSLHTRIFLVFMRNYEAKSPLFMIKRAGLYYVPRQSYSKNSHGSYILKWILVQSAKLCLVDNHCILFSYVSLWKARLQKNSNNHLKWKWNKPVMILCLVSFCCPYLLLKISAENSTSYRYFLFPTYVRKLVLIFDFIYSCAIFDQR